MIYAVSIYDGIPPTDYAAAGFYSTGIQTTQNKTGAMVTASVYVYEEKGTVYIVLQLFKDGRDIHKFNALFVERKGPFFISVRDLNLERGHTYQALCYVSVQRLSYVKAEVKEIKWTF